MSDKIDLNAPEVQEAIKAAVEAATKPLAEKRDELLSEVKKLRKDSAIKPEDFERLESERDDLKTQLTQAQKDLKTATTNAEKATKQLEAAEGFNRTLLVDNGLNEALAKAGVTNPAFLKASRTILAGQVEIVTEGDKRIAKVGDKPLSDFVTEWAKSDEGKHFVAAPGSSGGGAQGGSQGAGAKTMPRSQFDSLTPAEKTAFSKEGGKLTD